MIQNFDIDTIDINADDENDSFSISTNDSDLIGQTFKFSFAANFANYPDISETASIKVTILEENRLKSINSKLEDPYFTEIGYKLNAAILFDLAEK